MIRDTNRAKRVYPSFKRRARAVATTTAAALPKIVMNNSFTERGSANSLHYVPWGSQTEATAGGVDEEVIWIPPFGANTTIVSVFIFAQTAGGSTTVTIRQSDETVLATVVIDMASAQTMYEAEFDYVMTANEPIVIGIDPTTALNSVRTQIVAQETVAS